MELNLLQIANVSSVECIRQQVGLDKLVCLLKAYEYAVIRGEIHRPEIRDVQKLARTIEPDRGWGWRETPVTFKNGGGSCAPDAIHDAMLRLFEHVPVSFAQPLAHDTILEIVKHFLWIHPFSDGNGRVGWILYNWLRQTLGAPVPLPDFKFGE